MFSDAAGSFAIDGFGGSIQIEVMGYENPSAETVSDANWLAARVRLDVGGCQVNNEVSLTTQDLKRLRDGLEESSTSLRGVALLGADEEGVGVRVRFLRAGAVEVSGELKQLGESSFRVLFSFPSDQSYVSRMLPELRSLCRKVPEIEAL